MQTIRKITSIFRNLKPLVSKTNSNQNTKLVWHRKGWKFHVHRKQFVVNSFLEIEQSVETMRFWFGNLPCHSTKLFAGWKIFWYQKLLTSSQYIQCPQLCLYRSQEKTSTFSYTEQSLQYFYLSELKLKWCIKLSITQCFCCIIIKE